jgi:hypothetical protein
MKKHFIFLSLLFISASLFGQEDCFKKLEDAFTKRGSLSIADAVHENVIICFSPKRR